MPSLSLIFKKFTKKKWSTGPGGYPRISQLSAKAAGLRGMMYWMEAACSTDIADDEKLLQYACMHSFCSADRVCRSGGRFLTAGQHQ